MKEEPELHFLSFENAEELNEFNKVAAQKELDALLQDSDWKYHPDEKMAPTTENLMGATPVDLTTFT
jgi:hypothetical protein